MTIGKLSKTHKSVPVNPLLARAMYLKGYIEKSGTGTEDMIAKCKEWGVPAPEWTEDDADDFRVVLKRPMAEPSVEKALRMSACGDDRGLMESGNHSSALPVLLV